MAYLRIVRQGMRRYYYITESRREGAAVKQKTLEYLGRDPAPKRLKRALVYWGVKRPGKGGKNRT
jgi:hypothetical protein